MGLTLTKVSHEVTGNKRKHVYTAAFDSSYPTGGESLVAADIGLRQIDYADINPVSTGTNAGGTSTGALVAAKWAASLVLLYDGDSEVGNGTNMSDLTVKVEAFGY